MTIRSVLIAIPALFLGWLTVIALVMRFTDAAPGAVVLFPSQALMADLPPGIAVAATSPISVTLVGEVEDFARVLYSRGALLVLPAGLPGCLPLPATG